MGITRCGDGAGDSSNRGATDHRGPGSAFASSRQQVERRSPTDRGATVVHAELGVDALGVRPHGVQRDDELAGDVRTVEIRHEQLEHVELSLEEATPLEGIEARKAAALRVELDLSRFAGREELVAVPVRPVAISTVS